jgi:cyclopropane-fatty-acyl-phospholipid synthase
MAQSSAATFLAPVITALLGEDPAIHVSFWDGSSIGNPDAKASAVFRSPDAVRHILWSPGELGLSRAYVVGDIDFEGDIFYALASLAGIQPKIGSLGLRSVVQAARGAFSLGAIGSRPEIPAEETKPVGRMHSLRRDAKAISHHYDVGNDFYSLFLGKTWTYSCARFENNEMSLDEAQEAKYDLVCRKLGLHEGMRYLDVGCGWGGLLLHAAKNYGVTGVGITLSKEQADKAKERIVEAGLSDKIEIRIQDYRDLRNETFDAISSIGMFEHVGRAQMAKYFVTLEGLLTPGGRLLNHAIDSVGGSAMDPDGFIARYVFPDGELQDLSVSISAMQDAGFEVRDVESLREHYAKTLRHWVENLERNWDAAVKLVGERRARVWRIYMVGSAVAFEANRISIHQTLGVKTEANGESHFPATRKAFL